MTQISNIELLHRVERLEADVEDLKNEINSIDNLKETSAVLKTQYAYISNTLDELKLDIKSIKDKPAKYWDNIIRIIITVAVTALIAHIIHL